MDKLHFLAREGMGEVQLRRTEHNTLARYAAAVAPVADQRHFSGCKLYADLVRSAGQQTDLNKRQRLFHIRDRLQRFVLQARLFHAPALALDDETLILSAVKIQQVAQLSGCFVGLTLNDGEIGLFHLALLNLSAQALSRFRGFCIDDQPLCCAVETVDRKDFFKVEFLAQQRREIWLFLVKLAEQPVRLIRDNYILVLKLNGRFILQYSVSRDNNSSLLTPH